MLTMPADYSLVIQAGGRSSRMGEDKALKPFLGRPLVWRVIDRLAPSAAETLVTTNRPAEFDFLRLRLVPDLLPGRGALGGLYTALASASFPIVAVVACDMPFASAPLLERAVELLVEEEADIVVPRSPGGMEPLHAVYRRLTCLPLIRAALDAGQLKAIDWFPAVNVRQLSPQEVAALDPSGLAFWNINTPEEFLQAEEIARTGDSLAS
jgi:molybdopterin-guanine dinucleotide biosynthesis protein A